MAILPDDYQAPAANQIDDYTKERLQYLVKKPQEFLSELSPLQPLQLKEVQEHLWDVVIAESQKRGAPITRSDIISRFEPTTNYQYRAGCKEPLGYCTLNMCIKLDPKCSLNRLRGMIEVLRKICADLYKNEDLDGRLSELDAIGQRRSGGLPAAAAVVKDDPEVTKRISQIKSAVKNLREVLFSIIEIDGAETVALLDKTGRIVELVSNHKIQSAGFNKRLTEMALYYHKLGEKAFQSGARMVINEFDKGLLTLHPLNHELLILITSRNLQVPAKFVQKTYRIAQELNTQLDGVLQ